MIRIVALAIVLSAITAADVSAQTPSPAPVTDSAADPALRNAVTTYAMRSGKLALSSAANPGPVFLPDGTYTSEAGTIVVIVDGIINRVQRGTGEITEISNVRLNRQKLITLTPSTNALMAVSDFTLPSGTYKSEDGLSSLTVVVGRPTEFTLPPVSK
jgi:hypothetical protein